MVTEACILAALGRPGEARPLLLAGHAIRTAALPADAPRLRQETQLLTELR
jgi:hypothetical protein